jgi:hypothetical protein
MRSQILSARRPVRNVCFDNSHSTTRARLEPGQLIALPALWHLACLGAAAITGSPRSVMRYCADPERSDWRASILVASASSST